MQIINYLFYLALLFILPYNTFSQELADRLERHTSILAADSLEGRGLGTEGKIKAVKYITTQFEEAGISKLGDSYEYPFRFRVSQAWVDAINIVGIIQGNDSELSDEIIVLGAHFDHIGYRIVDDERVIYNGADDNASGVASIIEIGRQIASQKDKLKRSIVIVAFDAEESGLIGATRLLKEEIVDPEAIQFMFSLDMVGMYSTHEGLDLKGIESLVEGVDLVKSLSERHGIIIKKMGSDFERRTDTAPFAERGIPTAHAFTGLKSPYHKPEDTYEKLDYKNMGLIVDYLTDLVVNMSRSESLTPKPVYAKASVSETSPTKRFRVGGILHTGAGYHNLRSSNFRSNTAFNISAGLAAQIRLGNIFALQPEVLYDLNQARDLDGRFTRQALTVPLNFQISPGDTAPGVRFYLLGGPYFRYVFSGSSDGTSLNIDQDIQQNEWGYSFGIGIDIMKFTISWTLRRGLTNVYSGDAVNARDKSSMLTLGYWF